MAIKAVALITDVTPNADSTFYVNVRWAYMDTDGNSAGLLENVGPFSPSVLQLTFEAAVKQAVKDALNIGLLDTVRLIGATV
jgi:hypothetical protein